jgi:hypothetical protein
MAVSDIEGTAWCRGGGVRRVGKAAHGAVSDTMSNEQIAKSKGKMGGGGQTRVARVAHGSVSEKRKDGRRCQMRVARWLTGRCQTRVARWLTGRCQTCVGTAGSRVGVRRRHADGGDRHRRHGAVSGWWCQTRVGTAAHGAVSDAKSREQRARAGGGVRHRRHGAVSGWWCQTCVGTAGSRIGCQRSGGGAWAVCCQRCWAGGSQASGVRHRCASPCVRSLPLVFFAHYYLLYYLDFSIKTWYIKGSFGV